MSIVTLDQFRAYLRDTSDDSLNPVLQQALDTAQARAESFMGQTIGAFAGDVPSPIQSAIQIMAQIEVDPVDPVAANSMQARAESLLRPYRLDTGIAGGAA